MADMTHPKLVAARKLAAASKREKDAAHALADAALDYAKRQTPQRLGELCGAAKTYTNAMHQRSRCEKHAREAGGK